MDGISVIKGLQAFLFFVQETNLFINLNSSENVRSTNNNGLCLFSSSRVLQLWIDID